MTQTSFKSTHNLYFEIAEWLGTFHYGIPTGGFQKFCIGTVQGLWRPTSKSYDILAITNTSPGNGHLTDAFEWFENSCKRDNRSLRILEVWNKEFKTHLLKKRGFKYTGNNNVEKTF